MNKKVEYVGKDLEAMDFAVNYHRWILALMKPFLGKHLVEVGAGTGAFSELLLETAPKTLSLVEPSAMFETLQTNLAKRDSATKIRYFPNIFAEVAAQIETEQSPDSIIYINVLEHIEDDRLELEIIHRTLREKGRVFVFVPALPALFSEFDKQIGHFRRYRKTELAEKFHAAGFRILLSRYFDAAGIFPWLVKYRLLKSLTMESGAVHFYDKFVVPVAKPVESFLPLPLGKNLLFVAEKV
ncbi:MAG: class I SAM-dependent methyltransferase [Acidobacteriota bacterium]|nr:class I SAM-dependent methyltransferase [Acidobacteriota bacterium]